MGKKILKLVLTLSVFFLTISFRSSALAADWPTFRGNPEHTGVSSETIPIPLEKKWDYGIGESIYSSPIVAGGTVFVGSNDHYVYAVSATAATLVWKYETGGSVESTPLYYNGTVYFGSSDGYLYALDALNGNKKWEFNTASYGGGPVASAPVTDGTNVYFASGGANGPIFALNATSGAFVWQYDVPGGFSYPSPALVLSKLYNALFIGSEEGVVYAINTTGTTKWTYPTVDNRFSVSSPAVVGGTVYIGSDSGIVYAITAGTGNLDWSYSVGSDILASPAVTDAAVYFGSLNGNVYALGTSGATKGKLKWSYRVGGPINIKSSPVVSGNLVFIGATHLFFALDATTGDFKWSYGVGQQVASPAISNSLVYLASDRLYAFEATTTLVAMIEKWKYNTGSNITMSGVAVDGGVTYVGADDSYLYVINSDGTLKWRFQATNGYMISSTPVVSGGVVYFGARDNKTFYAVNTADGTLKWSKTLTGLEAFVSSTPTVVGGVIYVGVHNGRVYAWDAISGNQIWQYATWDPYWGSPYNVSSPIVDSGKVYISYANQAVVALDQATGNKIWETSLGGGFYGTFYPVSILLSGGAIYASGVDRVYALNLDGTLKWSVPISGQINDFVLWEGILIGPSTLGQVYAFDASSGSLKWQYGIKGVPGKPFLWQDVVFIMTSAYRVYALNAENGQLRFEYAGNFSPLAPVVTGGILYLGARDGRIYSEDIDNASLPVKASTGGTILTVYGDRLQIPPGALAADTMVTINISPNDQGGGGVVALPRKYRFGPDGTTFSTPATVKFAYKTSDLQGADPNTVKVYVWDSTASVWSAYGGTADLVNKTIDVSLNHFSDYALFGGAPELNFPVLAAFYLYGTPVTFKYSAFNPSVVTGVAGYLNDQPIESGTQVKLTQLGTNTFRVVGTKVGGGEVSQSITFEVAYAFEWLSPLTTSTFMVGETIPIKFKTKDFADNFVGDGSVTVEVVGEAGQTTGIFSSGKGNLYIRISESHYLVNLDTSKYSWIVPGGTYQIKVTFGSLTYPPYSFAVQ